MVKSSLEMFDSPVVVINQVYEGEDWSVVTSYVNEREAQEMAGEEGSFPYVGWHLSVTLPNLDDICFDQIFATPELALEFGIQQITSGSLSSVKQTADAESKNRFGHYASFEHLFGVAPSEQIPENS